LIEGNSVMVIMKECGEGGFVEGYSTMVIMREC
jgi:hypothetical protein